MSAHVGRDDHRNYVSQLGAVILESVAQLLRQPSHSRRAEAARRLALRALLMTGAVAVAIVALMYGVDVAEIGLMPPRGSAALWPVRILTDFGKDAYVLWLLAAALCVVAAIAPRMRGSSRSLILALGTRLEFLFLSVALPVLVGAAVKWVVGRGRPFVGGNADAFNFAPFAGSEAYASFPSSHAVTACALAFAVSAVWPQARVAMIAYALLISASRLVLLAHHPSDVVAGALIGVLGAMGVRYWFASRSLAFTIRRDGRIVPHRTLFG